MGFRGRPNLKNLESFVKGNCISGKKKRRRNEDYLWFGNFIACWMNVSTFKKLRGFVVKCRFAIFYEIHSMFRWWIHAYFATPRALYTRAIYLLILFPYSEYMLSYSIRSLLRFQETRCACIQITGYDSLGKAMTRKWFENRDLSTEIR